MRWMLVVVVGCSTNHHGVAPDAHSDAMGDALAGPDGDTGFCDSAATSGHAALTNNAVTIDFGNTFAGASFSGGDFAPGNPSVGIRLLFTNGVHVASSTLQCCAGGPSPCCAIEGAIANTYVAMDVAIGMHDAQFQSFQDTSFMVNGTVDITDFTEPEFQGTPGRVAGTVTTTGNGNSLNATFDAQFCQELLTETI
jgi:hypothetical protein